MRRKHRFISLLMACLLVCGIFAASFSAAAATAGAPAVPANITASPVGSGQIKLTWTLSEGATQYNIYRYDSDAGYYVYIGTSYKDTYTVKNLENGTEYSFEIVPVCKADGQTLVGDYSAPVVGIPENGPTVPSGIAAAPAGTGVVKLSWNPNPTTTQHNIYRYAPDKGYYAYIGTSFTDSYTVKNLENGTEYSFKIVPVWKGDGKTLVGEYSDPVTAVPVDGPAIPEHITATPAGSGTVVLSWDASDGATQYNIYRDDPEKGYYVYIGTSFSTSYTVKNLTDGTEYRFKLVPVRKADGQTLVSAYSDAVAVTPSAAPAVPENITAAGSGNGVVTLSWSLSAGATQYNIYRSPAAQDTFKYIGTSYADSYDAKGLTVGTAYAFKVMPVYKANGVTVVGAYSEPVTATAIGAPAKPSSIAETGKTLTTVSLSWSESAGATQYNLYRKLSSDSSFKYFATSYTTEYTVSSLTPETSYDFKVMPVCKANGLTFTGTYSDVVTVQTVGTPAVPTDLAAAATGEREITLTWVSDPTATQHNIYRYNGTKKAYVYIGTSYADIYVNGSLSNGTTYYYKVVPVTKAEGKTLVGAYSAAVNAKALGVPGIPQELAAEAVGTDQIRLSWKAVTGATQYNIYKYNAAKDTYVYLGTSYAATYTAKNLAAGTTCSFEVLAATKGSGLTFVGALSEPVSGKTWCAANDTHVAGEAVRENEVPATCSVFGSYDEVVYCSVCGAEMTRTEKQIAMIAHTPGEAVSENVVPSTCSAFGSYDEVVYCSVCSAEITRTEKQIEKTAHTPAPEAVRENVVPSTCSAFGSYDAVVYCSVCGEEVSRTEQSIEKLPHTPASEAVRENEVPPTCSAFGSYDAVVYCSVCGEEVSRTEQSIEKLPHTPAPEAVRENEVPPTCAAPGSYDMVIRCTVCGEAISSETFEIATLQHTPGSVVIENEVPATCIAGGSYDEVVRCAECGAELSRATVETDPNQQNHVGEQQRVNVRTATCIANGNTGSIICTSCGTLIEAGQVIEKDMSNHVGELEVRGAAPATCTAAGYTGDTYCLACNTVAVSGETIPAKGHTPVTDAAVAANCGYTGLTEGSHCSVCGEVLVAQTVTPIVGSHQLGSKILSKNSSKCDVIGYAVDHYRCQVCGKYFSGSTKKEIPESSVVYYGHSWKVVEDDAYLAQPKVCGAFAVYYKSCSKCGAVNYNETGKGTSYIGHNYQPNPNHIKTEATCLGNAVYYKDCIYCGANNGTEVMIGTSLGHDYSILKTEVTASTCTETGTGIYQCSRCDVTKDGVIPVNPDAHPEAKIQSDMTGVIAPTCTTPGEYYSSQVCKACGKILSQDEYHYVDPLPHNLHQIAAKAATCTAAGNIAYYSCYDCGKRFSDAEGATEITAASTLIPALGHNDSGAYERVYSRKTTCTVDGLYNEVLFCANGCGTALHTKPQQTETKFNHMKNGVSAEVAVPAAEATCLEAAHTAGTKCSLCGTVMSGLQPIADQPALGHDFSIPGNILNASAEGFYCSRCNATNPDLLTTFNTLVNSIKLTGTDNYNFNHSVASFGKSVSSSNYTKFKSTGIVNILPDVKSQFDQEMKRTDTTFSPLYSDGWIRSFLYLKNNQDVVSLLENGDVSSITVNRLNGLNLSSLIDSSYNGRYKDTSGNDPMPAYRNITVTGDVIAVTVTLRQETYKPATGISLIGTSGLTSLQKLTGEDIRTLAEQFGENGVLEEREEDSGYSMVSTMRLKSIVSNGSATYYFKASNYEPIAAVYDTTIVNSQDVSMSITLGISNGSITVDPYVTEKSQDIFLFFPSNS